MVEWAEDRAKKCDEDGRKKYVYVDLIDQSGTAKIYG